MDCLQDAQIGKSANLHYQFHSPHITSTTHPQMSRKRQMEDTQSFSAEISQVFTLFSTPMNWNSAKAHRKNY
jgi:hypothetical protein